MNKTKHPALFRHIEGLQGDRPWGTMLDAGTGVKSIRWLASLPTEKWTAVAGSIGEADRARDSVKETLRPQDQVVSGNWADPQLLSGDVFDTVLADYLLGAVEGFSPYFQSYLFMRLRPMTRSVLYVKGLEPYVPGARPETKAECLVWEIGRFRDACILLSGGRPYREYPAPWVVDHLQRAKFKVRNIEHFSIRYKEKFVNAQIDLCAPGLEKLADRPLATSLAARGEALRAEALEMIEGEGGLTAGRNYVVAAEPI